GGLARAGLLLRDAGGPHRVRIFARAGASGTGGAQPAISPAIQTRSAESAAGRPEYSCGTSETPHVSAGARIDVRRIRAGAAAGVREREQSSDRAGGGPPSRNRSAKSLGSRAGADRAAIAHGGIRAGAGIGGAGDRGGVEASRLCVRVG